MSPKHSTVQFRSKSKHTSDHTVALPVANPIADRFGQYKPNPSLQATYLTQVPTKNQITESAPQRTSSFLQATRPESNLIAASLVAYFAFCIFSTTLLSSDGSTMQQQFNATSMSTDRSKRVFYSQILMSATKSFLIALSVIYPCYKSYRALESRSIRECQAMLAYWSVQALLNAMQSMSDEMLGKYASYMVYKSVSLMIKLLPIIVGPSRFYDYLIKPFFESEIGKEIDTVVHDAHVVKEVLKENVLEPLKTASGTSFDAVREVSANLTETIKESISDAAQRIRSSNENYEVETQSNLPTSTSGHPSDGEVAASFQELNKAISSVDPLVVTTGLSTDEDLFAHLQQIESAPSIEQGHSKQATNTYDMMTAIPHNVDTANDVSPAVNSSADFMKISTSSSASPATVTDELFRDGTFLTRSAPVMTPDITKLALSGTNDSDESLYSKERQWKQISGAV